MTLAYVFWHWKQPDVPPAAYEGRQRAFHAAMRDSPPRGFARSFSHSVTGAPWANGGAEAYEDWYLVDGFASLETLNDGAVSAGRKQPHDDAAEVAASGAGGLYRLRLGEAIERPARAQWFGKPAGMSYERLSQALEPLIRPGQASLWMRQLVLGPGREFCVHSTSPIRLPQELDPLEVTLRRVWP